MADPNADLIGYVFETEHGTVTVIGSWNLNHTYVIVQTAANERYIRPAGIVRRHKQLS